MAFRAKHALITFPNAVGRRVAFPFAGAMSESKPKKEKKRKDEKEKG